MAKIDQKVNGLTAFVPILAIFESCLKRLKIVNSDQQKPFAPTILRHFPRVLKVNFRANNNKAHIRS